MPDHARAQHRGDALDRLHSRLLRFTLWVLCNRSGVAFEHESILPLKQTRWLSASSRSQRVGFKFRITCQYGGLDMFLAVTRNYSTGDISLLALLFFLCSDLHAHNIKA